MNTVLLALVTGLFTGGISCFAIQGGLLATSVANQQKDTQKLSIIFFLISKLIAYTILGFILGTIGSSLVITPKTQGVLQIFAGIVMLIAAARIIDLHPVFRKFVITPPKSLYRLVRKSSKMDSFFAPSILGFSTVLIPCGITQSMMLLAIAAGNGFWGALIMASFTIGTSPLFFTLGMASKKMLDNKKLSILAALIIFYLGISSLNTGQILRGSNHTLQNYWLAATGNLEPEQDVGKVAGVKDGKQEATIDVITGGYKSESTTLKAGIPVKLTLSTNNTRGCSRAFTIPEYNIMEVLPETGEKIVEFTPTKQGRLVYTCSMGMYTGYFDVI